MKRTLICCTALLIACCVYGCARRSGCDAGVPNRIFIDKAVMTLNGNQLALPATEAGLKKVLGEPSRVVSKSDVADIYVWDDAGIYAHQYKFAKPVQVGELSIVLGRDPFEQDYYPKKYFTGSLCVDGVTVTKDSTVADVNEAGGGEKFVHKLGGFFWSAEYNQRSVSLIANEQQFITTVFVDGGGVEPRVEVR
jgi:hypothetical protein